MNAGGDQRLIVFVKAPRAGFVKTRLAESIGPEKASAVYGQLVTRLLARLGRPGPVQLRFTPDAAAPEIKPWLRSRWTVAPQGSGDLGQRLERAFAEAFRTGAQRVVVIGSDCPEVSADDIEAAWAALRKFDLVLGPATDGGYWLVGLPSPRRELFREIPWSSARVLHETLTRAQESGLKVHLLRELSDVDTIEDWNAFLAKNA